MTPASPGLPFGDMLDSLIPAEVRAVIESTYYARINQLCGLAEAIKDPRFLESPARHVALFADHGVVHARDVARHVVDVLDTANGVLVPFRDSDRLQWMKAYGALLAYIHDIGMVNVSAVGRSMHPEFATQAVLGAGFDDIVARVWTKDLGGIATRVATAHRKEGLGGRSPFRSLREMLAMANCHSKSKIPVALLNDPVQLRQVMRRAATMELEALHHHQRANEHGFADATTDPGRGGQSGIVLSPPSESEAADNRPDSELFAWIEATAPTTREIVDDVIDTLRALRCADALRQRGTVMKTSGNYEVFVDQRTGSAVYALRPDASSLYLLEISDPIAVGEANISSSQLDADGNLRISFHHGHFGDEEATLAAARGTALVVNDIQGDAIESFERSRGEFSLGLRSFAEIRIDLEQVDDNPDFSTAVIRELEVINPTAAARVRVVRSQAGPAISAGPSPERKRYLRGSGVDWDETRQAELLRRVSDHGHSLPAAGMSDRMRDVRQVSLRAGEVLVEAGTPAEFVYVPLSDGLQGVPLGGYDAFTIPAWVFVGVTGVIRGASRNANVFAVRDLELLAIPKAIYLDHWHITYTPDTFAALFR